MDIPIATAYKSEDGNISIVISSNISSLANILVSIRRENVWNTHIVAPSVRVVSDEGMGTVSDVVIAGVDRIGRRSPWQHIVVRE